MSSSQTNTSPPPEREQIPFQNTRESRFVFRNFAEHQLRQELKDKAIREHCAIPIRDFAHCAEQSGLMVGFKCKQLHREVNKCMYKYNGEEAWLVYRDANQEKLERLARPGQRGVVEK